MKKLLWLLFFPTAVFAATANLTWDYLASDVSAFGVTNFSLERKPVACATAGTFAEVATPIATARTFADAVVSGTTYCYRIAAVGPGGKSAFSNTVEKLIPFGVPPAPGNLSLTITISLNPDTGKYQIVLQ